LLKLVCFQTLRLPRGPGYVLSLASGSVAPGLAEASHDPRAVVGSGGPQL
jgi:hypothetical protein